MTDDPRRPGVDPGRHRGGPLVWIVLPFVAAYLGARSLLRLASRALRRGWDTVLRATRAAIDRLRGAVASLATVVRRLAAAITTTIVEGFRWTVDRLTDVVRTVGLAARAAWRTVVDGLRPVARALRQLARRIRAAIAAIALRVARPVQAVARAVRRWIRYVLAIGLLIVRRLRGYAVALAVGTRRWIRYVLAIGLLVVRRLRGYVVDVY